MIRNWLRLWRVTPSTPPADDGPCDVLLFPADRVAPPQLRVLDLHDDEEQPEPVRGFPRLYDPDGA